MLKKTIKYENPFTGEEVEEDFYFHLTKAELIELEMSHKDGLSKWLENIVASEDNKQIIAEFKNIILSAYGIRSEDGRFFKKTQELRDEFESSEAYSALFMELISDDATEKMIEFVTGIMPTGLSEEDIEKVRQDMAAIDSQENPAPLAAVPDSEESKDEDEDKEDGKKVETITKVDLETMSTEELAKTMHRAALGEVVIEDPSIAT